MKENPRGKIGLESDTELVKRLLIDNYGHAPELVYRIRGKWHRVYAWKPCPLEVRDVERRGVYFGRVESDGIRLSIEGSFLVGPGATRNVVRLDDERARRYLTGENVGITGGIHGWVIVAWRDYFLGSAKAKDGRLINYIPKERRLRFKKA